MIHGMAQGGKDPSELKATWIDTLSQGLEKADEELPSDIKIDFPFYGDTLELFAKRTKLPDVQDVISKGHGQNDEFEQFMRNALDEMLAGSNITEDEVSKDAGDLPVAEKGPQNWKWIRAIARSIDRRFGDVAEFAIERFLKEVFLYVNTPGVTAAINSIVEEKTHPEETIIVSHSLGTIVGYKIALENKRRMKLRKIVTVGSPLGLNAINRHLGVPKNPAEYGWHNAFDPEDIVALHPLDDKHFPTDPEIVNNGEVKNPTENQHGIIGYLNDVLVARVICEAAL